MDLSNVLPSTVNWWNLLFALLVVVAAWIVSRLTRKGILALMRRAPGISEAVTTFVARLVGYAILILGFGIALALLGANIQPLLAIVIVLAVILVLVLRGVADNFAAGVLIQTRQTIKVGDELVVEAMDGIVAGTVTELNARSVLLLTVDGRIVHVPNAKLLSDPIINDSTHGARRSEVQVRIERADFAVKDVLSTLTDAAASVEGVHHREPVRTLALSVSTERVIARLQFWHHPLHAVPISSAVVLAVSDALGAAGWKGTVTSNPGAPPLVPPERI